MVRDCLPEPGRVNPISRRHLVGGYAGLHKSARPRSVEWSATAYQSQPNFQQAFGWQLCRVTQISTPAFCGMVRDCLPGPVKSTQFPEGIWLVAIPGYANQRARVLWNSPRLLTRANPISRMHLVGSYAGLRKSARPLCGMVCDCLPEPR